MKTNKGTKKTRGTETTCVIIDNELLGRESLKVNIDSLSGLKLLAEFDNIDDASKFLSRQPVDIIFYDIKAEGLAGLDFLNDLKKHSMLILTSAYSKHALDAFELDVVDYLARPLRIERFSKAVNKARTLIKLYERDIKSRYSQDDFIFIKSERRYVKINFNELVFIEGLKDYVIVNTTHGKYMTAMNVKTIHKQLPQETFFRVNKSFVVNINKIDYIDGNYVNIKDSKIPIGRSYRNNLIRFANKFLIKKY